MAMKKILVHDVIKDINSGLGDVPIMEKYNISASQYMEILEKLNKIGQKKTKTIEARLTTLKTMVMSDDFRGLPRCYLAFSVLLCDPADNTCQGTIVDISEEGFQVTGMKSQVGESRRFGIQINWLENEVIESQFVAECRWEHDQQNDGSPLAGFQITNISPDNRRKLKNIIELVALCDEKPRSNHSDNSPAND